MKWEIHNKYITPREIYMLREKLEHPIMRYLLALHESGYERAEKHIYISETIISFIISEKYDAGNDDIFHYASGEFTYMLIHGYIGHKLTGCLDESIGFPIDKQSYEVEWDIYAGRFFDTLISLMPRFIAIIEQRASIVEHQLYEDSF